MNKQKHMSLADFVKSGHPQAKNIRLFVYGDDANPQYPSRLEKLLIAASGHSDVVSELEYVESRVGRSLFSYDGTTFNCSIEAYFLKKVSWLRIDYFRSRAGRAARLTDQLEPDEMDDLDSGLLPEALVVGVTGAALVDRERNAARLLLRVCLVACSVSEAEKILQQDGPCIGHDEMLGAFKLARGFVEHDTVKPLSKAMTKRAYSIIIAGLSVNDLAVIEGVPASSISRSVGDAVKRIGNAARIAGVN